MDSPKKARLGLWPSNGFLNQRGIRIVIQIFELAHWIRSAVNGKLAPIKKIIAQLPLCDRTGQVGDHLTCFDSPFGLPVWLHETSLSGEEENVGKRMGTRFAVRQPSGLTGACRLCKAKNVNSLLYRQLSAISHSGVRCLFE